ncbi:MAG: glycosyltransferase, partial [Minisyncoccia bacterium]
MIGPIKPAILRWHVPFIPENFNDKIRKFIISGFEGFDGIIVSTKRDLEGLIRAGFKGLAFQVYPHIDPNEWKNPSSEDLSNFNHSYNINEDDFLILNVARMDPIKSQDVLIKAFAKFNKRVKNAKLMLIGDGSFTSSSSGLKSNKGKEWKNYLERLVEDLKIKDKVIFTGYYPAEKLYAAYKRADLFVL